MNDSPALQLARSLFPSELHGRVWLVGGAARDLLLGVTSADIDLVVALPEVELTRRGFRSVTPKSATPIFMRYSEGIGKFEATRIEAPELLEADLRRRDFTINALAIDLHGVLHDPLGGQADLAPRWLRACADDAFATDPARLFRALRFEADGWRLEPATEALVRAQDWDAALAKLPVERFSNEMIKALGKSSPSIFFRRMLELQVGRNLLPELFRMPQVPAGPLEHHPEGDLLTHCVEVLDAMCVLTQEPLPRFCAFFHDLGKLATDPADYPKHHGHDDAGFTLATPFCRRLALPAAWRKALAWSSRLHGMANRWEETRDSTRIRIAESAYKAGIADFLPLLAAADWPEGPGLSDWPIALATVQLGCAALGLSVEVLDEVPVEQRPSLILQRRVEYLRTARKQSVILDI